MRDRYRDESDRLMDLLSKILRVRGLTMRSVEKAAGMGENSLARLLQGKKNAYLSHVFRVLAALDIEPGEFFRLAYPQRPVRSTDELLDPRLVRVAAGGSLDEETESAPGPGERAAGESRL